MSLIFVTGPVRSGKSSVAATLAAESGLPVTYLATAAVDPDDVEWRQRIERHQRERPVDWEVREAATWTQAELCRFLADLPLGQVLILESLGTWLGGRIGLRAAQIEADYCGVEAELDAEAAHVADALNRSKGRIIVVCEQVGWDVVPPMPSARLFRDVLGRLGRRVAQESEKAYLVVSGFRLDLRMGLGLEMLRP